MATGTPLALDPITVEVIGKHLLAIAEEMEVILVMMSRSPPRHFAPRFAPIPGRSPPGRCPPLANPNTTA